MGVSEQTTVSKATTLDAQCWEANEKVKGMLLHVYIGVGSSRSIWAIAANVKSDYARQIAREVVQETVWGLTGVSLGNNECL